MPAESTGPVITGSCLLPVLQYPHAGAIADSTVFIKVDGPNDKYVWNGTGFIVADSAGSDGLNRIATAAHVLQNAAPGDIIHIYNSMGEEFGRGEIDAQASGKNATVGANGKVDPAEARSKAANDVVVLKMKEFTWPALQHAYQRIGGIPLAPNQSSEAIVLHPDAGNEGMTFGVSGGPVVNNDGQAIGLTSAAAPSFMDSVLGRTVPIATGGTIGGFGSSGFMKPVTVELPKIAESYIAPITDPNILRALGNAGQKVLATRTPQSNTNATMVGFPKGNCATFKGVAGPSS